MTAAGAVRRGARRAVAYAPAFGFAVALVGIWEAYVRVRGTAQYILPAPTEVGRALGAMAGDLPPHVRATLTAALGGLAIAAVAGGLLAVLVASWSFARRTVYPVLVVSQAVPAIVLAPLLVVWLGFGLLPKVVVVALVGFFPIAVASVDGLLGADRERVDLVRACGGSRRDVLRLVLVPSALPSYFSGLKIAATYATVGAVIGEWMGTSAGLGLVMTRAQSSFRTDRVFAAVVVVALVSLALFSLVSLVARLATPWVRAGAASASDDRLTIDDRPPTTRGGTSP